MDLMQLVLSSAASSKSVEQDLDDSYKLNVTY